MQRVPPPSGPTGPGQPPAPAGAGTPASPGGGGEREHLFDRPENVRWLLRFFYAACVLLLALDLVLERHVKHPWEAFLGFYALYGFVACWTLVVVAKLMRRVLMRDEDYYDVD